jgi:hypothetical protein
VLSAYEAHVAEILDDLPRDLAAFAADPRFHLHDARFVSVLVDQDVETVEMVVAALGYLFARLRAEPA